jgi:hypothetical protein
VGLAALPLALWSTTSNHSFDLVTSSIAACEESTTFDGTPTAASSLGLVMTSQVFDATGTVLVATGDAHTFTSIGEVYSFTVSYPLGTFVVGDTITVSVTDSPPSLQGSEGDVATATIVDCSVPVPTLPDWAAVGLALVLATVGAKYVRRIRSTR